MLAEQSHYIDPNLKRVVTTGKYVEMNACSWYSNHIEMALQKTGNEFSSRKADFKCSKNVHVLKTEKNKFDTEGKEG